ncbi:MAG TPA: DNA polymerase IV, partial [Candidatus Limnocylindria bacterium]|nr:DNA polymerase IV [Candidatus Limnocylindria bacterium]
AALCPSAIFVPVNGRKYSEASKQVMEILGHFSPLVEQLSIDEAFLDVTGTETLCGTGEDVARKLKKAVHDETGLTISVGVAANRLVAKIASDLKKPDGLVVVPPGTETLYGTGEDVARRLKKAVHGETGLTISVGVAANRLVAKIASDLKKPDGLVVVPVGTERKFLAPLPIERLWGVGASTRKGLADYNVRTIGDLAALPEDVLVRRFGKHGGDLALRAQGVGDTVVGGHEGAKSVSQETTFDTDVGEWEKLEQTLLSLSEGVARRLRDDHILCWTVGVKIRDRDFVTITRQKTLHEPTDSTDVIWRTAVALTRKEVKGKVMRLLGVAASGLTEETQLALFETGDERRRKAQAAADEVRHKFGSRSIKRARLIDARVREGFELDPRRLPLVQRDRGSEKRGKA